MPLIHPIKVYNYCLQFALLILYCVAMPLPYETLQLTRLHCTFHEDGLLVGESEISIEFHQEYILPLSS